MYLTTTSILRIVNTQKNSIACKNSNRQIETYAAEGTEDSLKIASKSGRIMLEN
jgi:hypothetical protein